MKNEFLRRITRIGLMGGVLFTACTPVSEPAPVTGPLASDFALVSQLLQVCTDTNAEKVIADRLVPPGESQLFYRSMPFYREGDSINPRAEEAFPVIITNPQELDNDGFDYTYFPDYQIPYFAGWAVVHQPDATHWTLINQKVTKEKPGGNVRIRIKLYCEPITWNNWGEVIKKYEDEIAVSP